jgi:hypothetical protein
MGSVVLENYPSIYATALSVGVALYSIKLSLVRQQEASLAGEMASIRIASQSIRTPNFTLYDNSYVKDGIYDWERLDQALMEVKGYDPLASFTDFGSPSKAYLLPSYDDHRVIKACEEMLSGLTTLIFSIKNQECELFPKGINDTGLSNIEEALERCSRRKTFILWTWGDLKASILSCVERHQEIRKSEFENYIDDERDRYSKLGASQDELDKIENETRRRPNIYTCDYILATEEHFSILLDFYIRLEIELKAILVKKMQQERAEETVKVSKKTRYWLLSSFLIGIPFPLLAAEWCQSEGCTLSTSFAILYLAISFGSSYIAYRCSRTASEEK